MRQDLQRSGFTLLEILLVISIICVLASIAFFSYSPSMGKTHDTVAQEDLRQAYTAAMAYFSDHPHGMLTQTELSHYGFRPSPNVSVSIIDGSPDSLFLLSRYSAPGARAYITYSKGVTSPGGPHQIWMAQWTPGGPPAGNPGTSSPHPAPGQAGVSGQNADPVKAELLEKCNLLAKTVLG
jgi:prepilin-type N-terminal cleavage/methylation domain-containing protein